jgi:dTMP kinase
MYKHSSLQGFLTIEGPEGSGKSTICSMLYTYLVSKGKDVILTREPGGIPISEQIRAVILDTKNTAMEPRTEALLYAAARRQHLVEKVIPALSEGKVVICDRFVDSSLAYQGHARGLGIDEVWKINEFAVSDCMPAHTLFFDVRAEVGMERIQANEGREVNRLDLEKIDFHHKVREGYFEVMNRQPGRFIHINAEKSIGEVFENTRQVVESILFKD